MGNDPVLTKIYNKIHKKMPLTFDDLRYLSDYAPECFEKTCNKIVNKMPETKPIIQAESQKTPATTKVASSNDVPQYNIDYIIDNITRLEANELPLVNVDANKVKNLLGSLYMELLVAQKEKDAPSTIQNNGGTSLFDTRI